MAWWNRREASNVAQKWSTDIVGFDYDGTVLHPECLPNEWADDDPQVAMSAITAYGQNDLGLSLADMREFGSTMLPKAIARHQAAGQRCAFCMAYLIKAD